eukprot:GDKI01044808.1.p1 GENE.GDKI01044808.1~~GDKI01044808.1.p1  ORF type:complete len:309 (+),score=67.76 GDKI01044808.1:172-1098(+)
MLGFKSVFGSTQQPNGDLGEEDDPLARFRRDQDEINDMSVRLQQHIIDSGPPMSDRVAKFWPSSNAQLEVLSSLVQHIPKGENPLEDKTVSDLEEEEEEKEKERGRKLSPSKKAKLQRRFANLPAARDGTLCLQWLGKISEKNRFAAVQTKLPETYEPWWTYANRVLVYVFGEYDDVNDLAAQPGQPFYMRCKNPRCVRLSHIVYLRDELKKLFERSRRSSRSSYRSGRSGATSSYRSSRRSSDRSASDDEEGSSFEEEEAREERSDGSRSKSDRSSSSGSSDKGGRKGKAKRQSSWPASEDEDDYDE